MLIITSCQIESHAAILWTDRVQTGTSPWGFDGLGSEHPIGTTVAADDANGVNLSRVADPSGGSGYAMRHLATFDAGGSRSQAGIYGDVNTVFGNQAKKPEGVWIASVAAFSPNGCAYGTVTRAELMASRGPGRALLQSGKVSGVVIVRVRGGRIEETKCAVVP